MGFFNDAGEAFNQVTDTFGGGAVDVVSDAGDVFNQYTDTIGDASEFGEQLVSDPEDAFNQVTDTIEDGIPEAVSDAGETVNQVTDTIEDASPLKPPPRFPDEPKREVPEDVDRNLYENVAASNQGLNHKQKKILNMLLDGKEQVKKAVEQGQIKITDTEKKIFDAAAEVVDTSSQDNNSDEGPVVFDTSSQDNNSDAAPEVVDTSSQDKGIIQIVVLAVAIAGTVGAYLWGKN